MASPSIFGSVTSWHGSSPRPRFTRSAHSPNSASLRALASESIGCRCCTGANPPEAAAPTRWGGEVAGAGAAAVWGGVRRDQRGVVRLQLLQLTHQLVVLGVRDARVVEHVVAVVGLVQPLPQLG